MEDDPLKFKNDDRLEFNDGVGDMLRPREKEGFGWFSTVLIVALSLIVILLSFWISFNVGKKIFLKDKEPQTSEAEQPNWDVPPPQKSSDQSATTAETDKDNTGSDAVAKDKIAPVASDDELLPPDKAVAKPTAAAKIKVNTNSISFVSF